MSQTISLVPAKARSTGIPGKNFERALGGKCLVEHAVECVIAAGYYPVVTSDHTPNGPLWTNFKNLGWLIRDAKLCADDTPMFDVVADAVKVLGLADDDVILLVQPTAVFRKPEHLQKAEQMLRETGADSVVSVVPLPLTHSAEVQLRIEQPQGRYKGGLVPVDPDMSDLMDLPARRQNAEQTYIRDGSVYAFPVRTIRTWPSIYGHWCEPLILDPSETCELDTEEQWEAVEKRWNEAEATRQRIKALIPKLRKRRGATR
jgi:CMP-N,N'-diacetyllegionaminic acid synthase